MNQIVVDKPDGGKALVLILEPANVHEIKQGHPVHVHIDDFFPGGLPKRRISASSIPKRR
jgi:hypothetical protein